MQMMNILKPIAFDVIHFMSQLFDYYLYAVYTFFGRNDMVCRNILFISKYHCTHRMRMQSSSLYLKYYLICNPQKKLVATEWITVQE